MLAIILSNAKIHSSLDFFFQCLSSSSSSSECSGDFSSVRFGASGAPNFPGTRQKSSPRPAKRGGAGDQFFLALPRAPSGAPFLQFPGAHFWSPWPNPRSGAPVFAVPCPGPCVLQCPARGPWFQSPIWGPAFSQWNLAWPPCWIGAHPWTRLFRLQSFSLDRI